MIPINLTANVWTNIVNLSDSIDWFCMVFVNFSLNRILYPEVVDLVKEEFLAILIPAMKSIGESRMTDHNRTVINGLLQKNLPIDTFEQDFKVAPHMG